MLENPIFSFDELCLQQMINMVAPHLLPDEDGNEVSNMSRDDEEYPVSALDSGVFRSRSRAFRKSAEES